MKNIILADCCKEEIMDFKDGLESSSKLKWDIYSSISNWGRTNIWLKIKRYLVYFLFPLKIFINRRKYKRILGWQQFYTLIFCFYCRLFNVKKTFSVYIVNFTYKEKKGFLRSIYFSFMKYVLCSKYIDFIFVPSVDYIDSCSKLFNISSSKFVTLPFGIPDQYNKYKENFINNNYILSIGRSNRDYDWLINEWKTIDYPLYIISDSYKPDVELSENIKIIDNVSGEKQFPYIMGCQALIIPIKEDSICSGDTVLLTAMSFKKNVIVTKNSTLAELYIDNCRNGFVVDKSKSELNKIINKIISKKVNLGDVARDDYLNNYSRKKMGENISKMIKGEE